MSSTSKKSITSKKPAAKRASQSKANGKTISHDDGSDKRYARRDADTGRFVEKANVHMERAWGKIYERSSKTGASKK